MADFATLSGLMNEAADLQRALANFDAGGRISSMTVAPPNAPSFENPMPPPAAVISTLGWEYPPTMVEAIKTVINSRMAEIQRLLGEAGVTVPPATA